MTIKFNRCFPREMKLNGVVKIDTWSERENLKSCLENKRSRQTRGVASLEVGVKSSERERVSLINCTRNVADLSKVSRISRGVG